MKTTLTMKHCGLSLITMCVIISLLIGGCVSPFGDSSARTLSIPQEQLNTVTSIDLTEQSIAEPVSVQQATSELLEEFATPTPPAESLEVTLSEVRAATLENNLDLKVELINPSISQAEFDAETAKFEALFSASARRTVTDSPTTLGTEGSSVIFDSYELGVDIPLRTGGTATVSLPFNKTETNNPFSLLNPAFTADLQFSISQPLLRNAGSQVSEHSIRIARDQYQIASARTKLEAIRILANADKAYWNLFSARGELEVRQKQYELSVEQLEQARRRADAGDVASIEVTRAESGVASSLENIIIAQTTARKSERELKRIMNRPHLAMTSKTALIPVTGPDPVGLVLDAEDLADHAITNRMEMLELELQLAIDASTVDLNRNARLPLVTLDYTYAINGLGSSYGRAFDQIPDHSFEDWSLGLTAEIPIGNQAAKARFHKAVLQRLQRLATKEQRETAIRQEVYDALDLLEQNWQRILAARQEAILAGRTYEAEKRQFEVGIRTSTDVLDAATRLSDAQSREVRALADYQISQIDIAFATGTLLGKAHVQWQPYLIEEVD